MGKLRIGRSMGGFFFEEGEQFFFSERGSREGCFFFLEGEERVFF